MTPEYVYIMVTRDKYELPLAVADSVEELAEIVGVDAASIKRTMERNRDKKKSRYRKVRIKR